MKVIAKYVDCVGHVLYKEDGTRIWSDEWTVHAPEDVTVSRDIGVLLGALGIEIEFEVED